MGKPWKILSSETLFAGLIVIGLLGAAFDHILNEIERMMAVKDEKVVIDESGYRKGCNMSCLFALFLPLFISVLNSQSSAQQAGSLPVDLCFEKVRSFINAIEDFAEKNHSWYEISQKVPKIYATQCNFRVLNEFAVRHNSFVGKSLNGTAVVFAFEKYEISFAFALQLNDLSINKPSSSWVNFRTY